MNRNENPNINSPIERRLLLLEKKNGIAKPINGIAKALISTAKPKNEITHAVRVVPMLAPIITEIDCANDSRPAFTKLTTITVVADEDCIKAVISNPVKTPIKRFEVIADRIDRMRSPAIFCKPSLIVFIPYKNKPNDPTSLRKSKNEYSILLFDFYNNFPILAS